MLILSSSANLLGTSAGPAPMLWKMKAKLFPCSLCSTILAVLMIESSSSPLNEEHVAHGFVLAVRRPYLVDIKQQQQQQQQQQKQKKPVQSPKWGGGNIVRDRKNFCVIVLATSCLSFIQEKVVACRYEDRTSYDYVKEICINPVPWIVVIQIKCFLSCSS